VGLRPYAADGPREPEIGDFIGELVAFLLEEDVFGFDVPVDEVLLVDALECLHHFHYHLHCML
jgi:hypothetical protein